MNENENLEKKENSKSPIHFEGVPLSSRFLELSAEFPNILNPPIRRNNSEQDVGSFFLPHDLDSKTVLESRSRAFPPLVESEEVPTTHSWSILNSSNLFSSTFESSPTEETRVLFNISKDETAAPVTASAPAPSLQVPSSTYLPAHPRAPNWHNDDTSRAHHHHGHHSQSTSISPYDSNRRTKSKKQRKKKNEVETKKEVPKSPEKKKDEEIKIPDKKIHISDEKKREEESESGIEDYFSNQKESFSGSTSESNSRRFFGNHSFPPSIDLSNHKLTFSDLENLRFSSDEETEENQQFERKQIEEMTETETETEGERRVILVKTEEDEEERLESFRMPAEEPRIKRTKRKSRLSKHIEQQIHSSDPFAHISDPLAHLIASKTLPVVVFLLTHLACVMATFSRSSRMLAYFFVFTLLYIHMAQRVSMCSLAHWPYLGVFFTTSSSWPAFGVYLLLLWLQSKLFDSFIVQK